MGEPPAQYGARSAAAHAFALRLEELRDVLPLAQPRRVPRDPTVLEVRPVIRRPDDAAHDPGDASAEGQGRFPFPVSPLPFNLLSPTPAPHTGSRASPPACGPTRPATTPAPT